MSEAWTRESWGIEMRSRFDVQRGRMKWHLLGWGWVDPATKVPSHVKGIPTIIAFKARGEARRVAREMRERSFQRGSEWFFRAVPIRVEAARRKVKR